MRTVLFGLFLFPALSFASSEFIVGLESNLKTDLSVEVSLNLVAQNPLCVEVLWDPTSGSVRGLFPIPTAKTIVLKKTQMVNDDIYEYLYDYQPGFCQYKPQSVQLNVESRNPSYKLKKYFVVYDLASESDGDVVIPVEANKGNVYWVRYDTTRSVPNVYISLTK